MGRSEKAIQRVEEGKGKTEEKLDEVMREMRPPVTPSPAPLPRGTRPSSSQDDGMHKLTIRFPDCVWQGRAERWLSDQSAAMGKPLGYDRRVPKEPPRQRASRWAPSRAGGGMDGGPREAAAAACGGNLLASHFYATHVLGVMGCVAQLEPPLLEWRAQKRLVASIAHTHRVCERGSSTWPKLGALGTTAPRLHFAPQVSAVHARRVMFGGHVSTCFVGRSRITGRSLF